MVDTLVIVSFSVLLTAVFFIIWLYYESETKKYREELWRYINEYRAK